MLPDLPKHLLFREEEVAEVRQKLLGSVANTLGITASHKTAIAVWGMGGAGKSVLANAVARDQAIRKHFRDGIFWITVGQESAGTEAKAKVLQSSLAKRLKAPLDAETSHEGKQLLRRCLAEKACLIILDDIWETADAQRLDVVEPGSSSRILITTREGRVATDLDAEEIALGKLSKPQAIELLKTWCGPAVATDPDTLAVIEECGYLPLALAICGARAREGAAWKQIAAALKRADLSILKRKQTDSPYDSVLKSIAASVDHMEQSDPELARRYRDLAVFPTDESVPESVVALLWAQAAGYLEDQAGLDLVDLQTKSLLTLEGTYPDRRIWLHNLQHDFIKATHADLNGAHQKLLRGYQKRCGGAWASQKDDGYFFQHLADHLAAVGRGEEYRSLLLNGSWLQARLRASGVLTLIADYEPFVADEAMRLIRWALRLSAGHLVRDRSLLRSQLHGRLVGSDLPDITTLLGESSGQGPWLRPLFSTLNRPGGELLQSLEGHTEAVNAVAITPDGRRAVSASGDCSLNLWDLESGTVQSLHGHSGPVYWVAVTADGRRAVSASSDRTLRLWDLESGAHIRTMVGHDREVNAVAITPDGRRAVSASSDRTLRLWDLESGAQIRSMAGHDKKINAVAVTADGRRAVSASSDRTLRLWDLESGAHIRTMLGHDREVNAVAVTPDGRRAVSASQDGILKLWDPEGGDVIDSIQGHKEMVLAVAVTADGRRAVSASLDHSLKVWDLESGTMTRTLEGHSSAVFGVAITPDGRRAASASEDLTIKVWDLESVTVSNPIQDHDGRVDAVAVTPDGRRAISVSLHDRMLKVWDIDHGTAIRTLEGFAGSSGSLAITPDGRRAVVATDPTTKVVRDLESGALIDSIEDHEASVRAVSVTSDQQPPVSVTLDDRTLKLCNPKTGAVLATFAADYPLSCSAISPAGDTIVAGDSGGRVHFLRWEGA